MTRPRCYVTWEWSLRAGAAAKLTDGTRLVLVALALHADETGTCWPSVPTLAALTGLDRRNVQRGLRALEAAGLIVTTAGPLGHVNRYRLLLGGGLSTTPDASAAPHDPQPLTPAPPGGDTACSQPATPAPPKRAIEGSKEPRAPVVEALPGVDDLAGKRSLRTPARRTPARVQPRRSRGLRA